MEIPLGNLAVDGTINVNFEETDVSVCALGIYLFRNKDQWRILVK